MDENYCSAWELNELDQEQNMFRNIFIVCQSKMNYCVLTEKPYTVWTSKTNLNPFAQPALLHAGFFIFVLQSTFYLQHYIKIQTA